MDPVEPVKPGWTTTEFWMTTFASIVGLLVAVGVIGQDDVQNVNDALANAVKSVGGFVAAAGILWKYIQSRAEIKAAVSVAKTAENNLKLATLGPNAVRLSALLLALFLLPCTLFAQEFNFVHKEGKYYLVDNANPANPNKEVKVNILHVGGSGPVVIPIPPPVIPSGDLAAVVKSAIAAVPAYEKKDEDRRVLAYVLNTLASAVAKSPDAKQAQAGVKVGCDLVVSDKAKWETFWTTINTKLNVTSTTSSESYAASLKEVSDLLVADLPLADATDEKSGERTFGLNLAKIFEIFMKLLPIIEMIIKGLSSAAISVLSAWY